MIQMWLLDEHTFLTSLWLRGVGESCWEEMNEMRWRSLLLPFNACNGGGFYDIVKFRTIGCYNDFEGMESHSWERCEVDLIEFKLKFASNVEVEALCELLMEFMDFVWPTGGRYNLEIDDLDELGATNHRIRVAKCLLLAHSLQMIIILYAVTVTCGVNHCFPTQLL